MPAMRQREMRGAIGDRERRGGDVIHRLRDRHDDVGIDRDLLGIAAAEAQHGERALPDPQVCDFRADLDDLAGGFETRGEREFRPHLVLAGDHQRVGEIDPAGMDPDARFVRAQRSARDLLDPQALGPAPFSAQNRFHAVCSSIASQ